MRFITGAKQLSPMDNSGNHCETQKVPPIYHFCLTFIRMKFCTKCCRAYFANLFSYQLSKSKIFLNCKSCATCGIGGESTGVIFQKACSLLDYFLHSLPFWYLNQWFFFSSRSFNFSLKKTNKKKLEHQKNSNPAPIQAIAL